MNKNTVYDVDFTRSLPPPLKNDKKMEALARTIAGALQETARKIHLNNIYTRINELPEEILDILAYDLHVDWFEFDYPIDTKRAMIRDSVNVHRRMGTLYAVKTVLQSLFPEIGVQEWFEYSGTPYTFRVTLDISKTGMTIEQQKKIVRGVDMYKNARSHLDDIKYTARSSGTVKIGAVYTLGRSIMVYPARSAVISTGEITTGGVLKYQALLSVKPKKKENVA